MCKEEKKGREREGEKEKSQIEMEKGEILGREETHQRS